jgi:hypothetical protein
VSEPDSDGDSDWNTVGHTERNTKSDTERNTKSDTERNTKSDTELHTRRGTRSVDDRPGWPAAALPRWWRDRRHLHLCLRWR